MLQLLDKKTKQALKNKITHFDTSNFKTKLAAEVSVDLNNQFAVAGFQFTVLDTPNLLESISLDITDRSEGFLVEFNELEE